MSKKKKVVITDSQKKKETTKKTKVVSPTVSKRTTTKTSTAKTLSKEALIFKRENYLLMLLGVGFIALGLFLMSGGSMPSPDVWDPNIIYSTRRTVLAPIAILAGLGIEIFAIFK